MRSCDDWMPRLEEAAEEEEEGVVVHGCDTALENSRNHENLIQR